jgi:4-diphosphocytidyl-2-C-methyl-D-erythritol kinase
LSGAPAALWLRSRAKLNLVLRVTGRRDDGYHLLDTLFQTLDLHDDVAVVRRDAGVSIAVTAEHDRLLVPADERNLAVRAVRLLQQEVAHDSGLHVQLHKRIPNGGGLGGGSSNAAAVLRMANQLLGAPLGHDQLAGLAVRLGADVPFFLRGGSQWGRGIGDQLQPAQVAARHFVLVLPPYGCDTAAVYKNHAGRLASPSGTDTVPRNTVPGNRDAAMGIGYCNELEPAAEQLRPELGRLRRAIADAGHAHVRMSGSGSTLFVATDDAGQAARCREELQRALADTEHRGTGFVTTKTGPAIDGDQPSTELPATLCHPPPDPLA